MANEKKINSETDELSKIIDDATKNAVINSAEQSAPIASPEDVEKPADETKKPVTKFIPNPDVKTKNLKGFKTVSDVPHETITR